MKRESREDNSDNDNDASRRRWRSLMGNIYCTQEAETSFNPRWCRVFLGSYLQLKLVWNDNTDLCSARPFWPIWLHSCQLTVWPLPGGNWSLPGTNGRRTGMLQALVCLEDNDKRPVWPCLDGSSFPPSERGHCARLPLGSGVCQHVEIQRWSTRGGQPSTTRGCSRDRRENDDQIIPMVLCPGLLFQGRGLHWTSTNNSQGKMRDWLFFWKSYHWIDWCLKIDAMLCKVRQHMQCTSPSYAKL